VDRAWGIVVFYPSKALGDLRLYAGGSTLVAVANVALVVLIALALFCWPLRLRKRIGRLVQTCWRASSIATTIGFRDCLADRILGDGDADTARRFLHALWVALGLFIVVAIASPSAGQARQVRDGRLSHDGLKVLRAITRAAFQACCSAVVSCFPLSSLPRPAVQGWWTMSWCVSLAGDRATHSIDRDLHVGTRSKTSAAAICLQ